MKQFKERIDHHLSRVLSGIRLELDAALELAEVDSETGVHHLCAAAVKIRQSKCGEALDLCSIVSAKTGDCSNDCSFCAQSRSASSKVVKHGLIEPTEVLRTAKLAQENGAHRFCLVTSGATLSRAEIRSVCSAVDLIRTHTDLKPCASLGGLDDHRALELAQAGLVRYHHNLETSRSFYPEVCSTINYDSKISTLQNAKAAGLEICTGGIFGLGETGAHRVELGLELRALDPDSVPINFLMPMSGTRLADQGSLDELEAIKYLAIMRFILPDTYIRLGAGRESVLISDDRGGWMSGINGLLIGNYLTVAGPEVSKDLENAQRYGLIPSAR